MTVQIGNTVKVEYEGKLEDGTIFDSSEKHGQPLEFEAGGKGIIKGFSNAVIGMEVGEEKEVTLKPSDAYGDHNPELVKHLPQDKIPAEVQLKVGQVLVMKGVDNQEFAAKVVKVNDQGVDVDLNHPFAGKTLIFKIKVVAIV